MVQKTNDRAFLQKRLSDDGDSAAIGAYPMSKNNAFKSSFAA